MVKDEKKNEEEPQHVKDERKVDLYLVSIKIIKIRKIKELRKALRSPVK